MIVKKRRVLVPLLTLTTAIALVGCGSSTSSVSTTSTTMKVVAASKWTLAKSANQGSNHNVLMAVTYAGADAWAVGDSFNGSSDRTLIEKKGSSGWVVVASPNASSKHNELDGISGTSPHDIWAVGRYAPASGQERTLIEYFNGQVWSIVPSPNVGIFHNELDAVVAIDPFDAWAVGHYDVSSSKTDKALIEHWNGTKWSVVAAPHFLSPISDLNGIAATPKNGPLWAVGSQQIGLRTVTLVMEYLDGVWRVVPSPNHGPYSNVLFGVATVSLRNMWAVGSVSHGSSSTAVTMHWDGQDIDLERVPRRLTHHYALTAVSADSQRRVFVVGDFFAGRSDVGVILQWVDNHWVVISVPNAGPLHNELLGVSSTANTTPVAVGKYYNGSADRTFVVHCFC